MALQELYLPQHATGGDGISGLIESLLVWVVEIASDSRPILNKISELRCNT